MTSTDTATAEAAEKTPPIVLMPRLDLSSATELANTLSNAKGDMVLDAKDVTHIGALGLQVLIAAARSAQDSGHSFQIDNLGEKPRKQLMTFGVRPETLGEAHGLLQQGEEEDIAE